MLAATFQEMMSGADARACLNALKDIYKDWEMALEEKQVRLVVCRERLLASTLRCWFDVFAADCAGKGGAEAQPQEERSAQQRASALRCGGGSCREAAARGERVPAAGCGVLLPDITAV